MKGFSKKNAVFLFGISLFVLEIFTLLYYANMTTVRYTAIYEYHAFLVIIYHFVFFDLFKVRFSLLLCQISSKPSTHFYHIICSPESQQLHKQLLTEGTVKINGVKNVIDIEYKIKSTCSLVFKFAVAVYTWLQFFNLLDEVDFLIVKLFILCKESKQHMIS